MITQHGSHRSSFLSAFSSPGEDNRALVRPAGWSVPGCPRIPGSRRQAPGADELRGELSSLPLLRRALRSGIQHVLESRARHPPPPRISSKPCNRRPGGDWAVGARSSEFGVREAVWRTRRLRGQHSLRTALTRRTLRRRRTRSGCGYGYGNTGPASVSSASFEPPVSRCSKVADGPRHEDSPDLGTAGWFAGQPLGARSSSRAPGTRRSPESRRSPATGGRVVAGRSELGARSSDFESSARHPPKPGIPPKPGNRRPGGGRAVGVRSSELGLRVERQALSAARNPTEARSSEAGWWQGGRSSEFGVRSSKLESSARHPPPPATHRGPATGGRVVAGRSELGARSSEFESSARHCPPPAIPPRPGAQSPAGG